MWPLHILSAASCIVLGFLLSFASVNYHRRSSEWQPIVPDNLLTSSIIADTTDRHLISEILKLNFDLMYCKNQYALYDKKISSRHSYLAYIVLGINLVSVFAYSNSVINLVVYILLVALGGYIAGKFNIQSFIEKELDAFKEPPYEFASPEAYIKYWSAHLTQIERYVYERINKFDSLCHKARDAGSILLIVTLLLRIPEFI